MSLVSMSANFLCHLVNIMYGHRVSTRPRILVSLGANILLFLFSTIMTRVDTDSWQLTFYFLTLGCALLFNVNDSVFQGKIIEVHVYLTRNERFLLCFRSLHLNNGQVSPLLHGSNDAGTIIWRYHVIRPVSGTAHIRGRGHGEGGNMVFSVCYTVPTVNIGSVPGH